MACNISTNGPPQRPEPERNMNTKLALTLIVLGLLGAAYMDGQDQALTEQPTQIAQVQP